MHAKKVDQQGTEGQLHDLMFRSLFLDFSADNLNTTYWVSKI